MLWGDSRGRIINVPFRFLWRKKAKSPFFYQEGLSTALMSYIIIIFGYFLQIEPKELEHMKCSEIHFPGIWQRHEMLAKEVTQENLALWTLHSND